MKRTIEQNDNLKKNLKYLKNKKGLTQREFASLVDINRGTYQTFESYGQGISQERLKKIYDFYGIDETLALLDHEEFIKRIRA